MKKILTLVLIAFAMSVQNITAQNLVPNPSFEDTVSCPTGGGQINFANGWSSFGHTPDYCNECNQGFQGVPINQWGYQNARSGIGYAGLITYINFATDYREFIGIQLTQALDIGKEYYISFFVSLGYNTNGQLFGIATNNIGAQFSTIAYSSANAPSLNNNPQVFANQIISDTSLWTRVTGSFITDSAYSYVIIGNFFSDLLTSKISIDTIATHAYYYVDDIVLSTDSNILSNSNEEILTEVRIFPNPSGDWLRIEGKDINAYEMYNVLGQKIDLPKSSTDGPYILDISLVPSGIYILNLAAHSQIIKKRIIVDH